MDSPFILVVEDDRDLADLLLFNLKQAGFSCQAIADGLTAWQWLQSNQPDLALLDIMLPGMDGLELCRRLCQRNTPVIMLTARDEEIDRVVGLELGADDYVTKPFSIRELLLRIKAVLRRREQQETPAAHLKVGRLYINSDNHYVSVNDEPLDLTVTEFNLLLFLARRPGRVLTRDFLLQQVWGYNNPGYARTVDTHIRRLRQKLEPADGCLETVRGLGYRFNAEQA